MNLLVIPHSVAAEERAHVLFDGHDGVRLLRSGASPGSVLRVLLVHRPDVVYLLDVASTTAVAAVAAWVLRVPAIVDSGDVVYELLRSTGRRSRPALFVVRAAEALTTTIAAHMIVRGRAHLRILEGKPATFAPDIAPLDARPVDGAALRNRLGLDGRYVVGLVGSLHRAPRLGITYGWDIVEAIPALPDGVTALIVGDGDGRSELEQRAHALGVAHRCHFAGTVPSSAIAEWIGAMDVAVSTQTADIVGEVRTTGKLPLYLACGCPVIASDVGEARRLLRPLGWTIPYNGVVDDEYPRRLAARITEWSRDGRTAQRRLQALEVHRQAFDTDDVRQRVWTVVQAIGGAR